MDRVYLKANLERIVRLAERTHLPGTGEEIADLARNALHLMARADHDRQRMGLVLAALAKATEQVGIGTRIIDPPLFRWAAAQAREIYAESET